MSPTFRDASHAPIRTSETHLETLAPFLFTAFALAGSPGPNTLSLAAVGAAFGRADGLRYMIGLCFGMALVIAITASGISGLLLAIPGAAPVVTIVAAAYFIYLAYRIATAPVLKEVPDATKAPRWYEGVMLSLVNPKAYASMAALFSGFILVGGMVLLDTALKAALAILVILVVNTAWLHAGAALTPFLRDPRIGRRINIAFAIALLLSVLATTLL